MPTNRASAVDPSRWYVELASPQLLDDNWRELSFDLATGQNVLQDLVVPESGGGYVYKDANLRGSPSHNRFLYWRTFNDVLELVEISSEVILDGGQIRIRFVNSPVINDVTLIELSDSVVIMIATLTSVHRLMLPHPKATSKSVLNELTTEILFNPANYHILNHQSTSSSQQPICAASWTHRNMLKCALSFPDSSMLIVQFSRHSHHVTTTDIKQVGIIGRIWSRMPNLLARHADDCDNAIFSCIPYHQPENKDVLLFTLCRDCKIRVFSTSTKECVLTYNTIGQDSFTQSFASYTNTTIEQPSMKMIGSHIVVYGTERYPSFTLFRYRYQDGSHCISGSVSTNVPEDWEKLISFTLSETKIWALATFRDAEPMLSQIDLSNILDPQANDETEFDGSWFNVSLVDDLDVPSVKNYVAEIFWRNRFSIATVQKALVGIAGPSISVKNDMKSLEELAFTRITDDNQEQAWARFYNYCLQNHQAANKSIGLAVARDESVVSVIKRSNPSFVCPWTMFADSRGGGGPSRAIKPSQTTRGILRRLNYISNELMDDEHASFFEQKLYEDPSTVLSTSKEITQSLVRSKKIDLSSIKFDHKNLISGIDFICDQIDLTEEAEKFGAEMIAEMSKRIKSDHNPLESNSGVTITFEMFRRIVRARMMLARDLLIEIHLLGMVAESEDSGSPNTLAEIHEELYTFSRVRRILDALRSYAILAWATDTPIKNSTSLIDPDVINFIGSKFQFFKTNSHERPQSSSVEGMIRQNLLMDFLIDGGVSYTSSIEEMSSHPQTLSSSEYVIDIALNLCKLLWPKAHHVCFAEYLYTRQLDEHLAKYLDLTEDWLSACQYDRQFIRAANCMVQNRAVQAVDIFNRLWMNVTYTNLPGRFIELDSEKPESTCTDQITIKPALIHRFFDRLTQLFMIYNNPQCLVILINNCMSLLDENADQDQQRWVNCFRAKLFQYYLELEEPDEAYHTMVLTTDSSLRVNCLRKFIVNHCEKEQWSNLLSYPFIDIKDDFIEILNQKAESSDLSKLNGGDFYKTSYYDLLFASYVSDDEFKRAAEIMFNYSQRLAHEVPGIVSIRKQADCLLIALNALRCVNEKEAYIEFGPAQFKGCGRSSILKRAYDCESEASVKLESHDEDERSIQIAPATKVDCREIELKYELTHARLKLLQRDQTANAIALSPLRPEEIIAQLVASSMFSIAIDLARLFRSPMDTIMEGLTAKFIFIMRLSTVDIAMHQDLERSLTDIFTSSYSNIDTYNYIANSTSSFVDRLWRLIDYYLNSYDGISHRYTSDAFAKTFAGSTVLMRIVTEKLLSAGYDIPASLRRMYMTRNTPELLKLLIKYDKLAEAADLATEMTDKVLEPSNNYNFSSPFPKTDPPVYLPTHLMILLISYLKEDATNNSHMKAGDALIDKLNKYRVFVRNPL